MTNVQQRAELWPREGAQPGVPGGRRGEAGPAGPRPPKQVLQKAPAAASRRGQPLEWGRGPRAAAQRSQRRPAVSRAAHFEVTSGPVPSIPALLCAQGARTGSGYKTSAKLQRDQRAPAQPVQRHELHGKKLHTLTLD